MRFLVIILLIAAATAAPTGGNVEDQSTKGSSPTPTAAQDPHSEHAEAGNHKVEDHKVEEVKEKVKEEVKEEVNEEVKEEAKEDVKEEAKVEAKVEAKKEAKEEVKEEVKEEMKEANQDDIDWEKRELKYQVDGPPTCVGKIEYKNSLSYGSKGYESVEEVERNIAECEVRVNILSEKGNKLFHYYATSIMKCGVACKFENSDITHPLKRKLGGRQESTTTSLVKTKEQEKKIEEFRIRIVQNAQQTLRRYTTARMAEVTRFNDNLMVTKAYKILQPRKVMTEALNKKALENQKKEEEALAKQKKMSPSEAMAMTVKEPEPEQPTGGDTKNNDVKSKQIEGETEKHEKTTPTVNH